MLAAIPTAAVLLVVAGLVLFLNQHTRLESLQQTDSALAQTLSSTAANALTAVAFAIPSDASSDPRYPAPPPFVRVFGSADVAGIGDEFGSDAATAAALTVSRARRAGGFAVSNVVAGADEGGAVIMVARAGSDGPAWLGVVRVSPDISGLAWQTAMRERLAAPTGANLAVVDGNGIVVYHDDRRRIGQAVLEGAKSLSASRHAALITGSDGSQLIAARAAIGALGWSVITERSWNPWREAFRGLGLVVLPPLLVAALLPAALIAMAAARATRPLRQLARAARRISSGDFRPVEVSARTGDEVEALAHEFDAMAAQLQSLYGSLGEQVANRTAELQLVVDVARAVSASPRAGESLRVVESALPSHPDIADAHVWLAPDLRALLGLRRAPLLWVPATLVADWVREERPPMAAECQWVQVSPGWLCAVPLGVREGRARLVVRTEAAGPTQDLQRFLIAMGSQVVAALDNAVLHRQGRRRAALEERTRLAREIHDTLAQTLTGVIVNLEAAHRAPQGSDHLHRALQLARGGLADARRSVQGLRTTALDDRTLGEALALAVEQIDSAGGLRARFTSLGDIGSIAPGAAAELLRVAEEALTNVARHSRASNVLVNLDVEAQSARLLVEDDGVGMNSAAQHGFGLLGMHERAARLGGDFTLESEPDKGTRIEVVIPLTPLYERPA